MKAKCPNCDSKEFWATAYVPENWLLNEKGEYLDRRECTDGDTLHHPGADDLWVCAKCGTEAKVTI